MSMFRFLGNAMGFSGAKERTTRSSVISNGSDPKRARASSQRPMSTFQSRGESKDLPPVKKKEINTDSTRSSEEGSSPSASSTQQVRLEAPRTLDPRQLEVRQVEEKDFIRLNDTSDASLWYLVDVEWLGEWKQFVTQKGPLPGPINNSRLISKETGRARPNLKPVDDYRGVNSTIWSFWHSRYGGGPVVRRKMLDLYAEEVPDPSDCKFSGVLLLPGSAHGSADADDQQVSSMFPSTGSRAPVDGSSQRNSQRSTGTASAPSAVKRASGGSRGKSVPPLRVSGSGIKQESLCCDKCDGSHETESCPYFKKPREKHQDAWSSLGKAKSLKSTDAEVVIVRNVRIIPQPGDGSCLFHSLSYGLGDRSTASSLRREISGFISKNPDMTIGDTFIKDWVGYDSNYQLTVHSYAQRMSDRKSVV